MKLIPDNPILSRRELTKAMDVSLDKIDYCLKASLQEGLVKLGNLRRHDRRGDANPLIPSGIGQRARLTARCLRRKQVEHRTIRHEIEELRREPAMGANA